MRMLLIASLIVIPTSSFSANFCDGNISGVEPGFLYESEKTCESTDCLRKVTANTNIFTGKTDVSLRAHTEYNFYYWTDQTPIANSLVAVQLKYLDLVPRPNDSKPVGVSLERYATPFACSRGERRAYRYIQIVDNKTTDGEIDYDTFDRFHRWGRLATDEDAVLHENFHIRYDNGSKCVRSDDGYRATLFLMHGRDALPGYLETVAYRVGLSKAAEKLSEAVSVNSAWAQLPTGRRALRERSDVAPFSHLKVLLVNYQKKRMMSGCLSFSVATSLYTQRVQPTELDLSFSDLEESMSAYPHPRWNYQAIYKFDID